MIKILCVGKIKEKFYRDAVEEYIKRLSKYTKVSIIEVDDINDKSKEVVLKKEKDGIMKYINMKDFLITLEIDGENINSIQLSDKINRIFTSYPCITFIIGGSYGLDESIKEISNYKLSFSKLTFPHQLFRVMLIEQIYRSYKIINNETYHK